MKLLLKLSLAVMLASSTVMAMTVEQFVIDPEVNALAPNLLKEINSQGIEAFQKETFDPAIITAGLKPPLLDDIAQVVSLGIFYGDDADWSRLEEAKIKAIQEHGIDALAAAANLKEIDIRRASIIVNTIYDTVINLPPLTKESYNDLKKASVNKEKVEEPKAEEKGTDEKKVETKKGGSSSIWDFLGLGLIKSSNTVRKVKGIVSPSNICETTNTEYLKGVDDIVYYSSLTHGLAGGALVSAPADSVVKNLDIQTIVSSVGKLAIAIQMGQSVASLSGLDPLNPQVRAITLLALASESTSSPAAANARDITNLVNKNLGGEIPSSILQTLADQASLVLITKGAGSIDSTPSVFNGVPIFRNLITFSSEVLNANSMGDVLKFAFCPGVLHSIEPKTKAVVNDIKDNAEAISKVVTDEAQKAFSVPKEGIANAGEEAKENAQSVGENIQEKVAEGTEKVNAAGEKAAEDVKESVEQVKEKVAGAVDDAAEKVAENAPEKPNEAKQEL
ncbi:hypothetical protein BGZ76_007678 [Entomortierella beljakovae]|nr:hypothetical protein BGZ76_007678 [Entomortierella beljakovae]